MLKQNNALKIINNRSGASMVFVLAVMLLLMAIGASALVAAGAASGAGANKQTSNQLIIYAESIQKSIMYNLLRKSGGDADKVIGSSSGPETLGGQILGIAYDKAWEIYDDTWSNRQRRIEDISLTITPAISEVPDLPAGITVTIMPIVTITPYAAAEAPSEDAEGNPVSEGSPEQPKTAEISGTATVEVTVAINAGGAEKSIVSVVTYDFSGGVLEESTAGSNNMIIANAGQWGFVSHEKADK